MADELKAPKPKNKKARRAIAITLVCVLLFGAAGGGGYYYLQNRSGEDVNVFPANQLGTRDSWFDQVNTGGPVRTDRMQSVYISATQTVTEVFVKEGQQVKVGDPILAFDTTLDEVELTRKQIAIEKLKLQLQDAKDTLAEIETYKVGTPGIPAPKVTPTPVPPEPTSVPWFQGGEGTAEDPYVFLWADGYMLDSAMVEDLLVMTQPTPTPSPEPTEEPEEPDKGDKDKSDKNEEPKKDKKPAKDEKPEKDQKQDEDLKPVQSETAEARAAQTMRVGRLLAPPRLLQLLRDGAEAAGEPTETAQPTAEPAETAAPTDGVMPVEASMEPTDTPEPSDTPTEAPTDTPTEAPTDTPTEAPTDTPTDAPTDTPTEAPTDTPTEAPTEAPTNVPTEAPTEAPTPTPVDSVDGTVAPAPGAPAVKLPDSSALAGLLTEEERQQAANGGSASVRLDVSDAGGTAAEADKALVEAKLGELGGESAVGQYLDLRLSKTVNGAETAITDLAAPIRLVIQVPEALRSQDRTFAVVRLHGGQAAILNDLDTDPNTVTFDTDRFSLYALVYADPASEPTDAPTDEPTDAPTDVPTDAPTEAPTDVPVGPGAPTKPTEEPTEEPTETPEPTGSPEPTETPEPTATPIPVGAGYYMVFEIRENNSMDGQILRVFELNFVLTDSGWSFLVVDPLYMPQLPELPEPDDSFFYFDASNYYPASEIKRMRMEAQQAITTATIQLRIAEQELKQVEYELSNGEVLCTTPGVVKTVLDPDEAREQDKPMILISGGGGYYITAYMSEFDMQRLHVGDTVTVDNYMSGETLDGTITDISQYPTTERYVNYSSDSGNSRASKYPFTVEVADTANLREDYWVSVTFSATGEPAEQQDESPSFYLQNAFLRSEGGKSYVYAAGADGLLEKRYVTTGRSMYGYYTEITSGLDMETDYIAFPYGRDVKPGAKTVQQEDISILYNGY